MSGLYQINEEIPGKAPKITSGLPFIIFQLGQPLMRGTAKNSPYICHRILATTNFVAHQYSLYTSDILLRNDGVTLQYQRIKKYKTKHSLLDLKLHVSA